MNTAEVIYLGEFRCESNHVQSGNKIITDAPTDNFGKGEAFSPTDLVATALATCMITTIGIQTRQMGINFEQTKLTVKKIMTNNPRRIEKIVIEVFFPKLEITDEEKNKIIEIGLNCPVAKSLNENLIQDIMFYFG
jgi:putative redox protein